MNGRLLLDTNVVIALFDGDAAVETRLAGADEVFVTSIVLGELYFGAMKSQRVAENLARIDEFATEVAVLDPDATTARLYGAIKSELREKGRPIPENDIWVAAVARQYGLTLLTRDEHFQEIGNLSTEEQ